MYKYTMAGLSPEEEQAIVDAYEAWDPRRASTEDLIEQVGVTRTTFYNVLRRNNIPLKTRSAPASEVPFFAQKQVEEMARLALDDIYRDRIRLRRRVALLEEAIANHPRCRHAAALRAVLDDQSS